MKSWILSRTNKPANKPPGEVAEVAKEAEAITTGVEIVVVEEAVAVVAEVVAAVVVVEETRSGKTKEKQTAQAWSCRDNSGGLSDLKRTSEHAR
jgi:hypothetical protein